MSKKQYELNLKFYNEKLNINSIFEEVHNKLWAQGINSKSQETSVLVWRHWIGNQR
jgi:hypothetical protein